MHAQAGGALHPGRGENAVLHGVCKPSQVPAGSDAAIRGRAGLPVATIARMKQDSAGLAKQETQSAAQHGWGG